MREIGHKCAAISPFNGGDSHTNEIFCQINCEKLGVVITPPSSSLTFEWLDSREAAQFLKVSVPMLRNMASNGQVPFYKLGRRNRYRSDELQALLLKERRGPP